MDRLRQLAGARRLTPAADRRTGLVDVDQGIEKNVGRAVGRIDNRQRLLMVTGVPAAAWELGGKVCSRMCNGGHPFARASMETAEVGEDQL